MDYNDDAVHGIYGTTLGSNIRAPMTSASGFRIGSALLSKWTMIDIRKVVRLSEGYFATMP